MNQDEAIQQFVQDPVHAVLLTGDGVSETARQLAKQLLHVTRLENQAYYRELGPDSEKHAIAVKQIRELIGFFTLKVPGGSAVNRVAVLHSAHAMTTQAQNALLKILEEPPEASVLILASSEPQKLLPTVRSRLQIIRLPVRIEPPDTATLELVKHALTGTSYDRLLMVESLKQKEAAATFVSTLSTVAAASLESAARKGAPTTQRWHSVLRAAYTAEEALGRSGNPKLVLTELMLAM
jgi:hypothetical protein